MKRKFEIRISPIHGKGLFATECIKQDEIIGQIRYKAAAQDGPYVLWINEQPVMVECDLKYINHSVRPNACYCDDLDVIALCDIVPGEEITHDYGKDWA